MADVLIGTVKALEVVRLKQRPWRPTLCNKRELPAEIVNILDAAIAATRTEGTHDVSAVAGKQHAPVHEAPETRAPERVDRAPLDLEPRLPPQDVMHPL